MTAKEVGLLSLAGVSLTVEPIDYGSREFSIRAINTDGLGMVTIVDPETGKPLAMFDPQLWRDELQAIRGGMA